MGFSFQFLPVFVCRTVKKTAANQKKTASASSI